IVGGDPYGRGVVSTASYEARAFGIRSAMPASHACRLCPQATFLRPDFEKYEAVSRTVMSILKQHTPLVEAVSLDEAYLDVTHHRLGIEDPVMIASLIKQTIYAVTKLTASAGVAPNLFLAKIASDFQKPNGLTVIHPKEVQNFLKDLPVRKIPGVGPVTEKALAELRIFTCGDLADVPANVLQAKFGKTGLFLAERAQGIDMSEVQPETEPKQYSTEETFAKDSTDIPWMKSKLKGFAENVFSALKESGRMGRTVVLKVKYHDFELITRSHTLSHRPLDADEIYNVASHLLETKTLAGTKPIRLIGLGISGLDRLDPGLKPAGDDLFDWTGCRECQGPKEPGFVSIM
ncbi:MAG: DNA polymerase IV, partial [Candidatus Omnitrophica bacterium]|nr:DNA polymerase IV [Candidatus Omnitrophota bacterium]